MVREGMQALGAHRLRTFFMMAGTIVGVAALTVIVSLGKGTDEKVMKRVNSFGTRAIMITAGGGRGISPPQEGITTLTIEDAEAIREQIRGIDIVAAFIVRRGMSVRGDGSEAQAAVMAIGPEWHDAWDWHAADGDPINADDVATMSRVCLLGTLVAEDLFGDRNPIGETILVGNVRLLVKGVLESRGISPMGDEFDRRVVVPITTGLRRVFNQDHVTNIRIKVLNPDDLESVAAEARALLHERHHITPPEEDDFSVFSAADIAKMARGISGTLTYLLSALAALSLLVGGVVLMNILLISVGERVPEIGLRRALGATHADIFQQFLAESLAATLLGMVVGCVLGVVASLIVAALLRVPARISWEPFALAVGFSLGVGLFFGVQPARRAARMRPADALR
jgi:putative ABC transport system permease protein